MDNKTLTYKNIIKDEHGNDILDICAPCIDSQVLETIDPIVHFVDSDETMRLDIIANDYYMDVSKLDAILYANHIYNPFAINQYDFLIVPNIRTEEFFYHVPQKTNVENTKSLNDQITDSAAKLNKMADDAKKNRMLAKASKYKNGVNEIKSPNELKSDEVAKIVTKTYIGLGTHINNT